MSYKLVYIDYVAPDFFNGAKNAFSVVQRDDPHIAADKEFVNYNAVGNQHNGLKARTVSRTRSRAV